MSGPVTDVKFAGDHMDKEKKKELFLQSGEEKLFGNSYPRSNDESMVR